MPIAPIITFKAGQCEVNTSSKPYKVKPQPEPGYIYLYEEDELVHFCWRKRNTPLDEPELDLMMIPSDGSFVAYEYKTTPQPSSKTNGRIFALKFSSSSQRHLFWLQSKPQARNGDPSWFSPRDRKIGDIVNRLLQGEEVNVTRELAAVRNNDDRPDDDDETMEDVEGQHGQHDRHGSGSGGAGADATGGDIREEGEGPREGGADGARAASSTAPDAAAAVRNFLESLKGQSGVSGGQRQQQVADKPYPYLNHLLPTSITIPMIDSAPEEFADTLISFLPPAVVVLASGSLDEVDGRAEPSVAAVEAAKASLSLENKRSLLKKVLRSPQFHQGLGSLTMALRDGGLPSIADALGVKVQNGGYLPGGGMPLGGGPAVEAFVDGVKKTLQEEKK
ncbi:Fc.00g064160.m01.CDS01 [Cosmosporella sp. VM-42]